MKRRLPETMYRIRLSEFWYWHAKRKFQKFIPWVARKLPKRIKYFVVIAGMSEITVRIKPDITPHEVSGFDLLYLWKEDTE